jgi:hypothetical protein
VVDKNAIGRSDTPFDMDIERGKIREFARATQSRNPDYIESPVPPIPPTFLTSSSFWSPPGSNLIAEVGLNLPRVLHGGQEYVFHGPPPHAGATLTSTTRIEDIYEKDGKRGGVMTFVISVQEFRDESGRLVAEARTTIIETGKAPTQEEG